MRFLADENCDMAVVRALRDAGHEVALVRDRCPGAADEDVVALAQREQRLLLTEDKDFGQLAHALSAGGLTVVLLRFPTQARSDIGATVAAVLSMYSASLSHAFVVIEPGQVRVTSFEP